MLPIVAEKGQISACVAIQGQKRASGTRTEMEAIWGTHGGRTGLGQISEMQASGEVFSEAENGKVPRRRRFLAWPDCPALHHD